MPLNEKGTRVRGRIRKDTRIGPVLNIKTCYRDEQYSIEVQVPSLFEHDTASWVRIVNGVDRYVTESMPTAKEEDIASVKRIATARPRQKPTVTLTSVSIPVLERKWIDIETQRSHDQKCYRVSKAMTRLLRHDESVPRGSDGAIHYNDIIEECRKQKFDDASQWLLEDRISKLAKGVGPKKRFQYCVNPNSSNQFLYLRAIQGHSGYNVVDPALQDNVLLPNGFTEYLYHVGNANELNSITRNGLISGGTSLKRGRQAVFFTTVNPMEDVCGMGETPCDLTKPWIAPYNNTGKRLQNTVFRCTLKLAQEREICNFTRHGHMQSFSTTHCLQLALRKRYV